MTGEAFEEALGLLLRWRQVRELEERFEGLGGPEANAVLPQVREARQHTALRLALVARVLDETLYEQFGQRRVDDDRAASAYSVLLRELGDPDLIVATTNYDRSAEAALEILNHDVDTEFLRKPSRAPTLDPVGLVARDVRPTG
jgi:hypothetical protein